MIAVVDADPTLDQVLCRSHLRGFVSADRGDNRVSMALEPHATSRSAAPWAPGARVATCWARVASVAKAGYARPVGLTDVSLHLVNSDRAAARRRARLPACGVRRRHERS